MEQGTCEDYSEYRGKSSKKVWYLPETAVNIPQSCQRNFESMKAMLDLNSGTSQNEQEIDRMLKQIQSVKLTTEQQRNMPEEFLQWARTSTPGVGNQNVPPMFDMKPENELLFSETCPAGTVWTQEDQDTIYYKLQRVFNDRANVGYEPIAMAGMMYLPIDESCPEPA